MTEHVNLTVTPRQTTKNKIEWYLTDGKKTGGPGHYPPVDCEKGKGYKFQIEIVDEDNLGIEFAPDPLWVVKDGPCPQSKSMDPEQIVDIKPGTTLLRFKNQNKGQPCTLRYQLNFVDQQGRKVEPLDPEIRNGGGNVSLSGIAKLALGFGIAAGLLALAALVRELSR